MGTVFVDNTRCLGFEDALERLKQGYCMAREGWNGKSMFVYLVQGSRFEVNREPLKTIFGPGAVMRYHPHIDMQTADGELVPWLASQTDILAEDWYVANE